MSKKIILIIIIIVLLTIGVYQVFLKEKKPEFALIEVVRGNIAQEIFESGQVRKGEKINLTFKNAGRIEKIYVEVGDEIKGGQELAKLDTTDLHIQLQEARISLELTQLNLNKLLAGAGSEEIKIAETSISNAEISLASAKQSLDSVYEDALITINDSYLRISNTFNVVDPIQRTYFLPVNQESLKVIDNKEKIKNAANQVKSYLEEARANSQEKIDLALSETKTALEKSAEALKIIREVCEEPVYQNLVSPADKTSLDTQRININTALANITNSQQIISSTRLTVESVKGQLQVAQNELARVKAEIRQEDIDLYEAQIRQAETRLQFYENQLQQSKLISPVQGKIIEIKKRVGELVQSVPQDAVMVILPAVLYEIKVNIYEEDVVKMSVGNSVEITLVAFPKETFEGKIISISPAEKIVEGVVYYETIIGFDEIPEEIKPGMTADVIIQANLKEDVLVIHRDAVQRRQGKTIVEVFRDGLIKEKEIEIGLMGSNDMVEVISGLKEGEKVIQR